MSFSNFVSQIVNREDPAIPDPAAPWRSYFERTKDVPGWFERGAVAMLDAIDSIQLRAGISGDLIEFGVHHGKSFAALCCLLRPGERAIGIDCFERQDWNGSGSGCGNRAAVEQLLTGWIRSDGISRNVQLFQADSKMLAASDLGSSLGRCRIVHIDGDHSDRGVATDLENASRLLRDDGLMLIDDYSNHEWPAVARQTWLFLERTDWTPIGSCCGRLLAVRHWNAALYRDRLAELLPPPRIATVGDLGGSPFFAYGWQTPAGWEPDPEPEPAPRPRSHWVGRVEY